LWEKVAGEAGRMRGGERSERSARATGLYAMCLAATAIAVVTRRFKAGQVFSLAFA
jgi:hypothetical protein